jgi:hypothetical protein
VSFQPNSGGKSSSSGLGIAREGRKEQEFKLERCPNRLKIHAPELFVCVLQLQAKLPPTAAFMSSPHENRFAHILVGQVNKVQALTHCKPLRQNREASLGADVDCVALCMQRPASFRPGYGHRNTGIQANSRADPLHPLFETQLLRDWHRASPKPIYLLVKVARDSGRVTVKSGLHTSLLVWSGYEPPQCRSMELRLGFRRRVTCTFGEILRSRLKSDT